MANPLRRPSSTSLEELLKRKRPAKPQKQGEQWNVDELVAAPLAGIQEFIEIATSPEAVTISLSVGNAADKADRKPESGMPEKSMPESGAFETGMLGSGMLDSTRFGPQQSISAVEQVCVLEGATPSRPKTPLDRLIPIPRLIPPKGTVREPIIPESGMLDSGMPESNVLSSDILDFGADLELRPSASTPVLHSIPPTKVQEIFTRGEAAVYSALWRLAGAVSKDLSRPYRDIRIGYIRLARESGMAWSNCRVNLDGLAAKLAISRVPPATPGGPSGYRVYGFSAVYRRVTDAGFTHYIRSGRGVDLHKAISGMPDTSMPETGMAHLTTMPDVGMPAFVPGMPDPGMVERDSGMPDPGMLLNSKRIPVVKPAPPPDLTAAAVGLVTRFFGRCDATYADRLLGEILSACPTATVHEVYAFIADNAPEIRQNQRIESKTGVLLSRAHGSFTGEALRKLRAGLPRWKEQQAFSIHRNDAQACDWEREWKQRYFDELNAKAEREEQT